MILKQDVEGYEIVTKIIRDFYKNYAITRLLQKLYEIFTKIMQLRDFYKIYKSFQITTFKKMHDIFAT